MNDLTADELGEDQSARTRWRIKHGRLIKPARPRGTHQIGRPFGRRNFSPKNIYHLFEVLRQRRIYLRMPQKELTKKLGIGENTLARWETGAMVPSALKFFDWCDALDIKLELSEQRPCSG